MTIIHEITVLPGINKQGEREEFIPIIIRPGDCLSIVGPTGSGKTAFINDIEVFAQGDTATKRIVLVNGEVPDEMLVRDPAQKPIAMITQNTKCFADLTVNDFLIMHIKARGLSDASIVDRVISVANGFTGEYVTPEMRVTSLSGGQTRALLISDALVIGNKPIILLDEIENAGIFKEKVISCLKNNKRAVIFVTHDPYVALLSERRIVMKNGAVTKVIEPGPSEEAALFEIRRMDECLHSLRERIRSGEQILGIA